MKRLLLVFNPKSGRGEFAKSLYPVVDMFTRSDCEVVVFPTAAEGDAYKCISERGAGFDLIVCAGGDGMVNEAVNACMRAEPSPTLGYIPTGTTNDFAVSLGIPGNIMDAAQTVLNGKVCRIDVGRFCDRYFAYVAAFGNFTDVPYSTPQNAKNIFGRAAYFFEAIKQLGNIKAIGLRLGSDVPDIRVG